MDNNTKDMTPEERRKYNKAESARKFGRYWLIYVALAVTAALSCIAGISLPMQPNTQGQVVISVFTLIACLYYAGGFLATGEGAAYFWFDKLVDHDPDNGTQIALAISMLIASVATILTTAVAAGAFIAYWLGALSAFEIMPLWAQKWVVYAIPALLTLHAVCGMAFKAVSDEAASDRTAGARIRQVRNHIAEEKANAKAAYWEEHAPDRARALGELEAQEELESYSMRLRKKGGNQPYRQPMPSFADETIRVDRRPEQEADKPARPLSEKRQ